MSLPKAQLVDPQGNMNLPGMTATGVVTATSLKGDIAGSATALAGITDLDVGIVTASSFVGQGDGHAANITGTPQLNLGITTATSFVGDATGKAAGLTGTPNLNVGLITATSFVGFVTGGVTGNVTGDVTGNITGNIQGDVEGNVTGNVSGLARGLGINGINVWTGAGTSNLGVGVCTATLLYGDGSGLVGAGSSAYIAQEVTATGAETIIDLSYGNSIYYKGNADTTVGFASTSAAEQITFIRDTDSSYSISYSTGGVDFDGTGDYLSLASSSDFNFGTDDYTIECWIYLDAAGYNGLWTAGGGYNSGVSLVVNANGKFSLYDAAYLVESDNGVASTGQWYHVAVSRSSNTVKLFVNGAEIGSATQGSIPQGAFYVGAEVADGGSSSPMNGKISNFRIVKGTAVYTSNFVPPSAALTNVTNTKLLCCQSDSSTTTAAVTPGTITANGDPTAGAQTVSLSGSLNATITWPDRVKWNNDTTPTLTHTSFSGRQIFRLTTVDTGLNYNAWQEIQTQTSFNMFGWGNAVPTGQLGDNSRVAKSSPIQIDGQWTALSNGHIDRDISIASKTNELYVWGNNSFGGLGQNDLTIRSSPTQVSGTWSDGGTACMRKACIASKTDGTAWVWGHNEYGALGLNGNDNARKSSPTQLGTDAIWGTSRGKFGAGFYSSFAIKTNGTLWSWGYNSDGQLGLNNQGTPTSKSSPTQIGTNTNWNIFCDTGYNWVGAIKTDGTLWMWGEGEWGQLGLNTGPFPRRRSSPTQVGTNTNWSNVVISYSTLASKTDGTLWSWGRNGEGELGLNTGGNPTARSSPTQIPGTTWTSNIAGGQSGQFAAVKSDGTIWAWGQSTNGQLGLNDAVNRSSPTQIPGTKWQKLCGGQVFLSLQAP